MGESFSYEDINKLQCDDIKAKLAEKVTDYIEIMGKYCNKEEIETKTLYLADNIRELIRKYTEDKAALNNFDSNNFDSSMIDVYKMEVSKYKEREKQLSSLLNDEKAFLDFFTSSRIDDYQGQGLLYRENGRVLYEGINNAVSRRVLATMALKCDKEGKKFNYVEDEDITELPVAKDSVAYELSNDKFIGPNLFKYFFNGDGISFHNDMNRLMTIDMIEVLNRTVDESDKGINDSYQDYYSTIKKVINSDNTLKSGRSL